ncbi:hypothetical protein [Geoglobus acetivorans]|uniref:Uncharacterized protein n=1 Tax=Geoglobus acetivorans TaxID=565033 RepID=A0A0A7GGX7_GEOAI|nr:hypothetical protein GACE_2094 [Geoglobus acetivorans]
MNSKLAKALIILFFVISAISVASAVNVTVTFSDLNLQKGLKVLVYDYQGKLIGEFNTTDTLILNTLNATSYIFVLKPTEQSWFSDPFKAVELLKVSAPVVLSYALYGGVVVGLAYLMSRFFR